MWCASLMGFGYAATYRDGPGEAGYQHASPPRAQTGQAAPSCLVTMWMLVVAWSEK